MKEALENKNENIKILEKNLAQKDKHVAILVKEKDRILKIAD